MFIHPPSLPSFPSSSPIVFSIPPSFPPSLPLLILPTLVLSPSHLPFLPLLLFFLWSFLLIYLSYHHYILPSYLYSFLLSLLLPPTSLFPPSPLLSSLSLPPSSLFPYFPLSFPLTHSLCAPVSCLTFDIKLICKLICFSSPSTWCFWRGTTSSNKASWFSIC